MYFLCLIFLPVVVVAFPVDSSEDSLFGSNALGGFADKVKGWTETAWSNSKVGTNTTNSNNKPNHLKKITIQNKTTLHVYTQQDWTETAWTSTKAGTKCIAEAGGDTGKWKECAKSFASTGNQTVTSDARHISNDSLLLLTLPSVIALLRSQ